MSDDEAAAFVMIHVEDRTGHVPGAAIVARRVGEMINGITPTMVAESVPQYPDPPDPRRSDRSRGDQ